MPMTCAQRTVAAKRTTSHREHGAYVFERGVMVIAQNSPCTPRARPVKLPASERGAVKYSTAPAPMATAPPMPKPVASPANFLASSRWLTPDGLHEFGLAGSQLLLESLFFELASAVSTPPATAA